MARIYCKAIYALRPSGWCARRAVRRSRSRRGIRVLARYVPNSRWMERRPRETFARTAQCSAANRLAWQKSLVLNRVTGVIRFAVVAGVQPDARAADKASALYFHIVQKSAPFSTTPAAARHGVASP